MLILNNKFFLLCKVFALINWQNKFLLCKNDKISFCCAKLEQQVFVVQNWDNKFLLCKIYKTKTCCVNSPLLVHDVMSRLLLHKLINANGRNESRKGKERKHFALKSFWSCAPLLYAMQCQGACFSPLEKIVGAILKLLHPQNCQSLEHTKKM